MMNHLLSSTVSTGLCLCRLGESTASFRKHSSGTRFARSFPVRSYRNIQTNRYSSYANNSTMFFTKNPAAENFVRGSILCRAGSEPEPTQEDLDNRRNILIVATGVSAVIALAVTQLDVDTIEDFLYGDGYTGGISLGNSLGALFWALALYYTSPVQQLLLFMGRIDTERPSDWVIKKLGQAAGEDVEDDRYQAPLAVQAATATFFILSGLATAKFIDWSIGDPTWSVSTGIASCIVAAVYELGRPTRLSVEEVDELEVKFNNFAVWADNRLERSGRCHFTEINKAFRTEPGNGRYRTEEGITDMEVRDMIKNWAPQASRTSSGYYKGLSVRSRSDPFTGESV